MRSILSKQSQRQLRILEFLYYNDSTSLAHLSNISNVSIQTIQEDIHKINEFISPLHIESYSQYECRLIHQYEIAIDYIYSCILSNSIEFRFLEKVFFQHYDRLEEYADSLFISLSTLKRILSKINIQTKKYGFYIATNPTRIVGDEGLIRNMFVNFFREKYLVRDYNFSAIQNKVFEQLLMSYIEPRENFKNYPDIEHTRITLYVSIIRQQNGYFYDSELIDKIKDRYNYKILDNSLFKQAVKSVFQIELTRESVVDLAYSVVSENFALDYAELIEFSEKNPILTKETEDIKLLVTNISNAINHFLTPEEFDLLILDLMNSRLSTIGETYLLYNHKHNFLVNLKKDYPLVYYFLHQHIIINDCFSHYEQHEVENLIYVLLTHWNSLLYFIQFSFPTFKIGMFMDSDEEHIQFLVNILSKNHYSKYTFESINYLTHQDGVKKFSNYDLILTNISLPDIKEHRIVSVDLYPSKKEALKLYQIYHELCRYHIDKMTKKEAIE